MVLGVILGRSVVLRGINRGFGTFFVAQLLDHFEDFATRGKHPTTGAFVLVQRDHEFDFVRRIVSLARCRVNLTTTGDLCPTLELSPFHRHGNVLLAAVLTTSAIGQATTINRDDVFRRLAVRLGRMADFR